MSERRDTGEGSDVKGANDTRRATFGGAAGALVSIFAFFFTALVVAHGVVPYWAFIPISVAVFAVAGCLILLVFPRAQPSARDFSRWFLIVGAMVLTFLLGHFVLQWW